MTRSKLKGPYIDRDILKLNITSPKTVIDTDHRKSVIHPKLIGLRIGVHNGYTYKSIKIIDNMVGHKLGEFAPTRMLYLYKRKKQISKRVKRK